MSHQPPKSSQRFRRRASIYLVVLSYASLVTIIGLSALLALRLQRRAAEGEIDFSQARQHARSAIELGMWMLGNNPAWRDDLPNGVWVENRTIGTGTYTLEGVDPNDGDLGNSILHPLVLTGTGLSGAARHKTQVRLEPVIAPLGCLEVALHAGADLNFNAITLWSNQTISANNRVDSINSRIVSSVEAVKAINGTDYTGTTTIGIDPRSMPSGAVFDYYLSHGTPISVLSLPTSNLKVQIANVVLSHASNPFGTETNPQGIYVIDCQGREIEIRFSRIVGTLVLLNPGSGSIIRLSVNWESAVENYPALLVSGAMAIGLDATDLSESALGVNFNPPGTPDEDEEDTVLDDTYDSEIEGLIYVSGNLEVSGSNQFKGVVIVGETLNATGTMDLTYRSDYFDNPPPGFIEVPKMRVVAGSWKQVVD